MHRVECVHGHVCRSTRTWMPNGVRFTACAVLTSGMCERCKCANQACVYCLMRHLPSTCDHAAQSCSPRYMLVRAGGFTVQELHGALHLPWPEWPRAVSNVPAMAGHFAWPSANRLRSDSRIELLHLHTAIQDNLLSIFGIILLEYASCNRGLPPSLLHHAVFN